MNNLLSGLSQAVREEHAFDFLYNLAAARDILDLASPRTVTSK